MATATRQLGRRATTNAANANAVSSDSGVPLSPSSTASTATPPRRYVLDVPTGRTRRASNNRTSNDDVELSTRRVTASESGAVTYTNVEEDDAEQAARLDSREYYYRDGAFETSESSSRRYTDEATMRQFIDSNVGIEDQEVQALTSGGSLDVKQYPINVDPNPEMVVRPNTQRLTYTQDIAVRYLKPATPPPPGPIIIREIRAPPAPPAPPIILRQRPPPPRTPSPIIIREKPPSRPKSVPTTVIKKVIPPPPPPPRKLIIERLPKLPPKPRPVIIERWLPYHKQKRQVIHEKAKPLEPMTRVKNTIIEWRPPEVELVKHVKKLGVTQADPYRYSTQHGDQLYTTEFVQRKLTELGLQEELALMQEQRSSVAREDAAMEQASEYSVRQILNGYSQSSISRPSYASSAVSRLVQSSYRSGVTDEYGEQRMLYDGSPNSSSSYVFETNNYASNAASSNEPILTEDVLLRSHASNDGRFPTHLLRKLGSQAYDLPADQIDPANGDRRVTTTTTRTRYYTVAPGEISYEAAGAGSDDAGNESGAQDGDENYVRIKASDLKDVLANYDAFSSTGEKLAGEQLNF